MDTLAALNGPDLVVKFQNFFGVHSRKTVNGTVKEFSRQNGCKKAEQNGNHYYSNGTSGKNGYNIDSNGTAGLKQRIGCADDGDVACNGLASNGFLSPVEIEQSAKEQKNKFVTDEYIVTNKLYYYLFHFGANLGNEIFYITFYPFWIWNIDGFVGRRVCIFWALFMYFGQATKDILKMPRPAAPPVMRMEKLYALEYGMPSTHAMVGAGFPFTILYLTWQRYIVSFDVCT